MVAMSSKEFSVTASEASRLIMAETMRLQEASGGLRERARGKPSIPGAWITAFVAGVAVGVCAATLLLQL